MKKTVLVLLALLCMLLPVAAFAAGTVFEIKEIDLKVAVPETWSVFTRSTPANDPRFAALGVNGSEMVQYLIDQNIYLDALIDSPRGELVVKCIAGMEDIFDLNLLSDAELQSRAKGLMNSEDAKSAGLTYTGYTLYKHKQAKFYVFDFTLNSQDGLVYGRQYMTVINGKMYNITLHSYSGQLTQQSRDMQKSVVDNTTFTVVKKKPGSFDWGSVAGSALRGALIGGGVGLVAFLARKFLKRKA